MAQGKGLTSISRRLKLSTRTWRIIGIAAGVLALAMIVLASSALSKPKTQTSPATSAAAQQVESATLTNRGLTALSANDTATAETLLQRAVALNPQNKRAAVALTRIRQSTGSGSTGGSSTGGTSSTGSGSNGSTTGGTGSNPAPAAASPFDKKVSDISKLLPLAVSGYTMYPPVTGASDAEVSGDPSTRGVRVIWAVHDRGTVAAASKYITNVSKRAYSKSAQTAVVDGATVYLGTDGSRYATAAYARGRYVFEVLVSLASTANDVAQTLPMAKDAAAAFPDTP